MYKVLNLTLVLIPSFYLIGFIGQTLLAESNENITVNKFSKYRNQDHGLTMEFPSNWLVSKSGLTSYNDIVSFNSPLENISDVFPESLKLSVIIYNENLTLSDYTALVNATLQLPNIRILEENSTITLSQLPAKSFTYLTRIGETNLSVGNLLIYTVKNNLVYSLLFHAEPQKYYDYLPIVSKMIESFQITHNTKN